MFRDLRERITPKRRAAAWALFALVLAAAGLLFLKEGVHPALRQASLLLLDALGAVLAVRALAYLLLDPLLSDRKTATPGFLRDLLVVGLYAAAGWFILKEVLGVGVERLLGTGAIAAAVIGFSLQETLGNLFAGIVIQLDKSFQEGDWVEVSGNLRGGQGRDSFVGQVQARTWRAVHLRTENGDTDILPNRVIAAAVVTNLYAPSGFHRRTARVLVAPHPELHRALARLAVALAGIPHPPGRRPEVVVHGFEQGGAVLEMRWWALGYRHGRTGAFLASRLACSVLPREGFALMGPSGPGPMPPPAAAPPAATLQPVLARLGLPEPWAGELAGQLTLRRLAPEEAVIREGDAGDSLFAVLSGRLAAVRAVEGTEPYTGLFWERLAEFGPGAWFGEASLLTGAPRSATVVALEACEVVELPKAAFELALGRNPSLVEHLVDLAERRPQEAGPSGEAEPRRAQWRAQILGWFGLGERETLH